MLLGRVCELLGDSLGLDLDVLDRSNHVESSLGVLVASSRDDLLERADGLLEGNQLTLVTSEDGGDGEGLCNNGCQQPEG